MGLRAVVIRVTGAVRTASLHSGDIGRDTVSWSNRRSYFGGSTLIVAVGPTPAVRIHIGSFPTRRSGHRARYRG